MKKIIKTISTIIALTAVTLSLSSCTEAERVSYNLSQEADNFNIVRQLTVINCLEGDVLFQMTGQFSINADPADNQLEITVKDNDRYSKHFVGLSDNVTYIVEDLNIGDNDVSNYSYTLNFNPKMWLPVNFENMDSANSPLDKSYEVTIPEDYMRE